MRVALYTLGCKVNSYETEQIREAFIAQGDRIVPFTEPADVYIVNTCTVTQMAAKKSRQILHRARRLRPEALIIAAGCYAEHDAGELPEGMVDLFVSNKDKLRIPEIALQQMRGRVPVQSASKQEENVQSHTRGFLKVQDGCRQFCTYCIIPYVRGPLVSRDPEKICAEAQRLAQSGCREIVLTGIHLSSYGREGTLENPEAGCSLPQLIRRLSEIREIDRIRLGSLEPGIITQQYVQEVRGISKLCPHYHLSLQSGCARTLKAMNWHYTPEEYLCSLARLREEWPDVAVTTDLIVGFPGETDKDFEESMDFLKKAGFAQVHVFKYSRREGTVAAGRPDQVPEEVKSQRSEQAIELAERLSLQFARRFTGTVREVLLEKRNEEGWEGYTDHYVRTIVRLPEENSDLKENQMVRVLLQEAVLHGGEIYLTGVIA